MLIYVTNHYRYVLDSPISHTWYHLSHGIVISVTADDQMILSDVTNTSNEWFEWSEENSLGDAYWTLCDGK